MRFSFYASPWEEYKSFGILMFVISIFIRDEDYYGWFEIFVVGSV